LQTTKKIPTQQQQQPQQQQKLALAAPKKYKKHKQNPVRNQHYDKFYYCNFCEKWIEKIKAVWIYTPKRKYPTCPKLSCNNNRLKTKSTNYKSKSK
jgi:hypothetical protein